jgi:hypothetical protein
VAIVASACALCLSHSVDKDATCPTPFMSELDRACPSRLSLDAEFGGAERARSLV